MQFLQPPVIDRVAGSVGNVCICGFRHLEGLNKFVVNGFVGPLGTLDVGDSWGLLGPRSAYGNLQPSNGWSSCPVCKAGSPFVKSAEDYMKSDVVCEISGECR